MLELSSVNPAILGSPSARRVTPTISQPEMVRHARAAIRSSVFSRHPPRAGAETCNFSRSRSTIPRIST
jgi:hypothetical protein